ncbi:MAG: hypothetical protein ACJAUG_000625 [Halioglobus sp.]
MCCSYLHDLVVKPALARFLGGPDSVAVFEGLIHGPDAAMPALKPLLAMMGLAVVLALILRLSVFRTRGEKTPATSETEEAA